MVILLSSLPFLAASEGPSSRRNIKVYPLPRMCRFKITSLTRLVSVVSALGFKTATLTVFRFIVQNCVRSGSAP